MHSILHGLNAWTGDHIFLGVSGFYFISFLKIRGFSCHRNRIFDIRVWDRRHQSIWDLSNYVKFHKQKQDHERKGYDQTLASFSYQSFIYPGWNLAMSEANQIGICRICQISGSKYWHLCGCILIHHYLCGNYWCFNKSVSHDACAVAVCLFCKRDSFFIRLAACGENARHLTLRFNVWICIFILICTCRMDEIWLLIKISGKPDLISHKREITTPAHDCRWYTFPKQNKCKTEPFCQGDNISHIQFWRDCLLQKVEDSKESILG